MDENISMRNDIKYWVAISNIDEMGPVRFKNLYSFFSSMQSAWQANASQLRQAGLADKIANNFLSSRNKINPDEEMEKLMKEKIQTVTILDDGYPKLLKELYAPPAVLYYKGKLIDSRDKFGVGVVGTRKFSAYGKRVTENLAAELAKQNITIISGLALGIDTLAHTAVVQQKGRTIAVMGAGLAEQNIYPSINRYLADKIVEENGLLLSEYPIDMMPLKQNFPQRNRIISGLSIGVIIIEAPERSGALLTARYALEQNRDVFAVPGNIFQENSVGPHNLIKMGAKLVASAEDVLEALNLQQVMETAPRREITADNHEEEILLGLLSAEPIHINDIIKKSGIGTSLVNSTIALMEIKGKVKNLGNMMYVIEK
ncbi:MAG: DNA-processing protein DprA [Candidatus Kuenenbacteria bacterium]